MTYQVITIDRNKNVVRTTVVNTWTNALETVRHGMLLARDDKWVVYPQGFWEAPRYAKGLNGCYTTSFGMAKRNEVGQSSYFFTYIKKAV